MTFSTEPHDHVMCLSFGTFTSPPGAWRWGWGQSTIFILLSIGEDPEGSDNQRPTADMITSQAGYGGYYYKPIFYLFIYTQEVFLKKKYNNMNAKT